MLAAPDSGETESSGGRQELGRDVREDSGDSSNLIGSLALLGTTPESLSWQSSSH